MRIRNYNCLQFPKQNQTRFILIDIANKNLINKFNKILKQINLIQRQNAIINDIVSKKLIILKSTQSINPMQKLLYCLMLTKDIEKLTILISRQDLK